MPIKKGIYKRQKASYVSYNIYPMPYRSGSEKLYLDIKNRIVKFYVNVSESYRQLN